ncbi:MAG: ATP-binding protein [Anaerolineae bacterium]|nr:ATP-binding protein [Anaerolineae bacterium]NUQ06021.1 ATP-binding protein [Anaerolineae bacterium]
MANNVPQSYDFRIDLRGIIKLLAKHLYSDTDVFVREMLQNAHDAIERRRLEEGQNAPLGGIRVGIDRTGRRISFSDNGAGLTETEIHEYLATIGRSGTQEFRAKLIEKGRQAESTLIGQFGIGLLSAFVVADEVEIITRSFRQNQPAWRWSTIGDKSYTLGKISDLYGSDRSDESRDIGTIVNIYVATDQDNEILNPDNVRKIIRKYADFMKFPIYLDEETTPCNVITPPWARAYSNNEAKLEEYYSFLNRRFQDIILHVIPVEVSVPIRVRGALFVTNRVTLDFQARGAVDVYQNGMFVQSGNREVLPPWAKFVGGVLDSPDLTLTLNREGLFKNTRLTELAESLGRVIVDEFKALAQHDPSKLQRLLSYHGTSVKAMALTDDDFFSEIAEMIPFETNRGEMNLQTYFRYSSTDSDRGQILHFTDENSAILYFLLADKQGLVVINAGNPLDEELLRKYATANSITLKEMTDPTGRSVFYPLSPEDKTMYMQLEVEFRRILENSSVEVVRFRPEDMPAIVMQTREAKLFKEVESASEDVSLPASISKLLKTALSAQASLPTILYLNAENSSIQRLTTLDLRSAVAQYAMTAIVNNSLLLSTRVLNRQKVEDMVRQFNQVVDLLISNTMELDEIRQSRDLHSVVNIDDADAEKTDHVSCFVAIPFSGYDFVLDALKEVFEDKPNFWQVVRADEEQLDPTVFGSVYKHIRRSHLYVAEISDRNFNVGLELGIMQQYFDRPRILLRKLDAQPVPVDLHGAIYVSYSDKSDLLIQLREQLRNNSALRALNSSTRFLSPIVLNRLGLDYTVGEALSREFVNAMSFLNTDTRTVSRRFGLSTGLIEEMKEGIRRYYDLA